MLHYTSDVLMVLVLFVVPVQIMTVVHDANLVIIDTVPDLKVKIEKV